MTTKSQSAQEDLWEQSISRTSHVILKLWHATSSTKISAFMLQLQVPTLLEHLGREAAANYKVNYVVRLLRFIRKSICLKSKLQTVSLKLAYREPKQSTSQKELHLQTIR